MRFQLLACLLALADAARVAMEAERDTVTMALDGGWEKLGAAENNAKIELSFLLKQTNLDKLASTAMVLTCNF